MVSLALMAVCVKIPRQCRRVVYAPAVVIVDGIIRNIQSVLVLGPYAGCRVGRSDRTTVVNDGIPVDAVFPPISLFWSANGKGDVSA